MTRTEILEWLRQSRFADKSYDGKGGYGYHFNEWGLVELLVAFAITLFKYEVTDEQ